MCFGIASSQHGHHEQLGAVGNYLLSIPRSHDVLFTQQYKPIVSISFMILSPKSINGFQYKLKYIAETRF